MSTKPRFTSITLTPTLRPSQIRHVARRRLADAKHLLTGGRERANGAIYLGGFVIECHLKAALLEKHPRLRWTKPGALADDERSLWSLVFRQHDLDGIIAKLPGLMKTLKDTARGGRVVEHLGHIAGFWTVRLRYSSIDASLEDARLFLQRVEDVHQCLERLH